MRRVRKHIAALLALLVFGTAAIAPLGAAMAQPCPMMAMGGGNQHSPDGMMPDCGHDMACIVMAALPAGGSPATGPVAWAAVHYWLGAVAYAGLTISPDPSPPKSKV